MTTFLNIIEEQENHGISLKFAIIAKAPAEFFISASNALRMRWTSCPHKYNTINESYLTDPSIVSIIQLGLPYSSLTAEEWRIIQKSFETFGSKQPIGIGASLAENMIEANVYLISNPSKDKIFNQ